MPGTERFAQHRPQQSPGSTIGWNPLGAVLLLFLSAPAPAPAQRLPLPPNEQEAVNHAIDRGVVYLKRTQQKNGTWPQTQATFHGKHPVGYATLPGLTLLECGVPPSDPLIQNAAKFLRSRAGRLDTTYELSLGILFLDRIGDPKDEKIIQTFALRLMAGQSATGGWGYRCPPLSAIAQKELLTALRHLDPPPEGRFAQVRGGGKKPGELAPIAQAPGAPMLGGMAVQPGVSSLSGSTSRGSPGETHAPSGGGLLDREPPPAPSEYLPDAPWRDCLGLGILEHNEPAPPEPEPKAPPVKAEDKPGKPSKPYTVPERLRLLPVVQDPALHVLQDPANKPYDLFVTTTDNSNTQFAILALWTAQRHDVPMRRSLNLIVRRFVTSQNADGAWGYHYRFGGGNDHRALTMTCVGLIGLAVGHGLAQSRPAGQPVQDQRIINGLIALSRTIGQPVDGPANLPMQNLYYLWSLERVAVLYNLPKIGDKDWYRWGAQVLIRNQDLEGYWERGQYVGSSRPIDTCLALLFLKRANLVKDLTAKLPFTAEELNEDILKKLLPPPSLPKPKEKPKKTVVAAEPPKPAERDTLFTKPTPAQTDTATSDHASAATGGSKKKWIVVSLILFVVFAGCGLFFILFAVSRRNREGSAEKPGKRKDAKKKRKPQVETSPHQPEA